MVHRLRLMIYEFFSCSTNIDPAWFISLYYMATIVRAL